MTEPLQGASSLRTAIFIRILRSLTHSLTPLPFFFLFFFLPGWTGPTSVQHIYEHTITRRIALQGRPCIQERAQRDGGVI